MALLKQAVLKESNTASSKARRRLLVNRSGRFYHPHGPRVLGLVRAVAYSFTDNELGTPSDGRNLQRIISK
jgi:hypothetical protein